jgi:hypothetical protein
MAAMRPSIEREISILRRADRPLSAVAAGVAGLPCIRHACDALAAH